MVIAQDQTLAKILKVLVEIRELLKRLNKMPFKD